MPAPEDAPSPSPKSIANSGNRLGSSSLWPCLSCRLSPAPTLLNPTFVPLQSYVHFLFSRGCRATTGVIARRLLSSSGAATPLISSCFPRRITQTTSEFSLSWLQTSRGELQRRYVQISYGAMVRTLRDAWRSSSSTRRISCSARMIRKPTEWSWCVRFVLFHNTHVAVL